jgi:hypothetical protein
MVACTAVVIAGHKCALRTPTAASALAGVDLRGTLPAGQVLRVPPPSEPLSSGALAPSAGGPGAGARPAPGAGATAAGAAVLAAQAWGGAPEDGLVAVKVQRWLTCALPKGTCSCSSGSV